MKYLKLLIVGLLFIKNLNAQQIHFSNMKLLPVFLNPAWNHDGYNNLNLGIVYRNQSFSASPNPYQTYGVYLQSSFKYKEGNESKISLHGMFLSDKSGPASLQLTSGNLGIAYHLALDRNGNHYISGGVQGSLNQLRISDINSLVFEENLNGGNYFESFENLSKRSFQWKIGIMENSQLSEKLSFRIGGAISKLSYLNQIQSDNSNVLNYSFHLEFEKYINDVFSFSPKFYYQKLDQAELKVIQGLASYQLKSRNQIKLQFGGGLRIEDAAIILLGVEFNEWKFGLSYDISISDLALATNSASGIEFGIMYTYNFPKEKIDIEMIDLNKISSLNIDNNPIISIAIKIKSDDEPIYNSKIVIINEINNDTIISSYINSSLFTTSLVKDTNYKLIVSKDGFLPEISHVSSFLIREDEIIEREVDLEKMSIVTPIIPVKVVKGKTVRLNEIYYDYNDYKILPESENQLLTIYRAMLKYKELKIELSSHTDSRGDKFYNLELSTKRAKAVTDWLTSKGIEGNRIISNGFGEAILVNHCKDGVNCSEEEHKVNRRSEFKIIEGPDVIYLE